MMLRIWRSTKKTFEGDEINFHVWERLIDSSSLQKKFELEHLNHHQQDKSDHQKEGITLFLYEIAMKL
jgi:hypothetical protein